MTEPGQQNDATPSERISSRQLASLLQQHGRSLAVYAAQWSTSPEDCVQDSFVKLAATCPPPENCVAWLFTVTKNHAINSLRSHKRRTEHESLASYLKPTESSTTNPASAMADSDEQNQLVAMLSQLVPQQREIVVMRIWSELTWHEIGQLTDTSSSSAQRHYVAAIEQLKTLMESSCLTKRK